MITALSILLAIYLVGVGVATFYAMWFVDFDLFGVPSSLWFGLGWPYLLIDRWLFNRGM